MDNATSIADLPPLPSYTLKPLPSLIPLIPDYYLSLALPIIAYWAVSMVFHAIDQWDLFPQYRLHTPAEVLKRNRATRWDVFRDVVIQQIVQTLFGLLLVIAEDDPVYGKEDYDIAVWATRIRQAQRAIPGALALFGVDSRTWATRLGGEHAMLAGALMGGVYPELSQTILSSGRPATVPAFAPWELLTGKAIYHFIVPAFQFILAVCMVDTWQYFLHRAMHMNKYLYTTLHARHHRLYVPYAYGALYNHPFEGFLLDTVGAGIAYLVSGMTVRQSIWFFTCTTIKTVDDHCGYSFPWDPLQHLTSNNAGYHDVHHQTWGIKSNFSQPFFTFWDSALGTKWTGGDVSARYERAKLAAQKKVDVDDAVASSSITSSDPADSVTANRSPYGPAVRPITLAAHSMAEPYIPPGKATRQALGSRQQILDDHGTSQGIEVLADETAEEISARKVLQQQQQQQQQQQRLSSPRKRAPSNALRGLADRVVGEGLHGRGTGMLGVENGSR